ncbi:MAG: dUTP diphosphatase [Alkalispirochaeta sp.]
MAATIGVDADNTLLRVRVQAHPEALPVYASDGAAGADLRALVPEAITLLPGRRAQIPTGLHIELPIGFEGQVRPRSGLAAKFGITVLNAPGTIDSDYRGEILVPLINLGDESFLVERGMRIAQLVIAPVTRAAFEPVDVLTETDRGANGFGSSGVT